jgi:hypothetical protein
VQEAIQDRGHEAVETFGRFTEHLTVNGVDFSKTKVVLGPWLEMDSATEQFVGGSELATKANQLARGHYRAPFVIPESV